MDQPARFSWWTRIRTWFGLVPDSDQRARRRLWTWLTPIPLIEPEMTVGKLSDEFSRDVAGAAALLRFLIKESGPQAIRDQTIDDIEAARDLVENGATPQKEARANLLRAYRDLALVPRIAVASARMPPALFWSDHSQWPGMLLWLSVMPSSVAFILLCASQRSLVPQGWHWPLAYLVVSAMTIVGLYVFSGSVTNNKINQMIKFCYVITGFALMGSLLPFFYSGLFDSVSATEQAPLGILRGCVVQKKQPDQKDFYPTDVACSDLDRNPNIQWVARLGGVVADAIPSQPMIDVPLGVTVAPPAPGRKIIGGLVVPLYVIVLALFGGAISMTRRIPEYQRRAMDSKDPLTNAEAREKFVFQIMQVATAPLLAVTVYYIVSPKTPLDSVVIGFGSGFASEAILTMIGALVEKLKPASPRSGSSPIDITLTPSLPSVAAGGVVEFTAHVSGTPNSEVTWLIDPPEAAGTLSQNGSYVAPDSPPKKAVTITARSVADPTRSASASVKFKTADAGSAKVEPSVKVDPPSATLGPGKEQQFKAEVLGLASSKVVWSIDPLEVGEVTEGSYKAPPSIKEKREVTVTATSDADSTKFGTAKVTLDPSSTAG